MIITIAGEQEFIKTTETTVSDAKRVYISWAKESVTTENKYVEHKELTDKSKPMTNLQIHMCLSVKFI